MSDCGLEIRRGGDVHAEIEEALRHVVGAGRLELVLSAREAVRGDAVAGGSCGTSIVSCGWRHAGEQIVERRLVARNDLVARSLGLRESRRRRHIGLASARSLVSRRTVRWSPVFGSRIRTSPSSSITQTSRRRLFESSPSS
jgi:hypothetical protein